MRSLLQRVLTSPKVKGAEGECVVLRNLRHRLKDGYIILNDVYLPLPDGATTQIDHIVVSSYGIFAVETKNYAGWIFADVKSKVWTQMIYRKKSTFQNPMRQNYLHVCAIADNLGIDKRYIKGVIAFVGGCTFKTECPEGVVYSDAVADYIKSFTEKMIKPEQVPEIAQAILEWQGTITRERMASHVENLKHRHLGVSGNETPRCPRCGSAMVLRTSKSTGRPFYGCSSYPECRGIVNYRER